MEVLSWLGGLYHHPDYQFEVHYMIGIVLCIVAGFIVGSEREKNGKPAGISTHSLVLMGSMLFTKISQLPNASPNIAAYIVSGIGFLGAGVIMKNQSNKISNLTTAAGVWVSAAIGMAIGYNLYFVALITVIVASIGLHFIPHPHKNKSSKEKSDGPST